MFALHIADVGGPAVRLQPKQLLEINGLGLGLPLFDPLLGGISAFDDDGMPSGPRRVLAPRPRCE
jgi:hypothetical protein